MIDDERSEMDADLLELMKTVDEGRLMLKEDLCRHVEVPMVGHVIVIFVLVSAIVAV